LGNSPVSISYKEIAEGIEGWAAPTVAPTIPIYSYFSVYSEDNKYVAVQSPPGTLRFESTNPISAIDYAFNNLPSGRTHKENVLLRGTFIINLRDHPVDPTQKAGIVVPNYTRLYIDGIIKLVDYAYSDTIAVNYIICNRDRSTPKEIEIIGGEIDGNADNNTVPIYGIEIQGNTKGEQIEIRNVYVHDTRETGIAFEGTIVNSKMLFNRVKGRKDLTLTWQDGIGNQYGCKNIEYIGNEVWNCYNQGIYIEGGESISVLNNKSYNNRECGILLSTFRGSKFIKCCKNEVRYNDTAGIATTKPGAVSPGTISIAIIADNITEFNVQDGIYMRHGVPEGGQYLIIENNLVRNNARLGQPYSGIVGRIKDSIIQNNICIDDQATPTQEYGIALLTNSTNIKLRGNICKGNELGRCLFQSGVEVDLKAYTFFKTNPGYVVNGVASTAWTAYASGADGYVPFHRDTVLYVVWFVDWDPRSTLGGIRIVNYAGDVIASLEPGATGRRRDRVVLSESQINLIPTPTGGINCQTKGDGSVGAYIFRSQLFYID